MEAVKESGKDILRSGVTGEGIPEELRLELDWEAWLLGGTVGGLAQMKQKPDEEEGGSSTMTVGMDVSLLQGSSGERGRKGFREISKQLSCLPEDFCGFRAFPSQENEW